MKRILSCFLTIALLLAYVPAFATLTVSISNVTVRAGEEESVWYNLPEDGLVTLSLLDGNGEPVAVLFHHRSDHHIAPVLLP